MQAVHIPLPIRQHRRRQSGLPALESTDPWYVRLGTTPWTWVTISAAGLYYLALFVMYVVATGARAKRADFQISRATADLFRGGLIVWPVVLIAAGVGLWFLLRWRPARGWPWLFTAAMIVYAVLLAGMYLTLFLPVAVPLSFYDGIRILIAWLGLTIMLAAAVTALTKRWRPTSRGPWLFVLALVAVAYALALYLLTRFMYVEVSLVPDLAPDINDQVVWPLTRLAGTTLLVWLVIYFLLDRWRPQRGITWFLALGWGAAMATLVSMYLNTAASTAMHISPDQGGSGYAGAASAVFVAPFIEEAAKATVLFGLVILLRYRMVTRLNVVVLAGLSAAGFAFTENIIYYLRAYAAALEVPGATPLQQVLDLALVRGVLTAWGHPLFTTMTALGMAFAVGAKSKSVRVLAPVAGYLLAALGHMTFNMIASVNPFGWKREQDMYTFYTLVAVGIGVALLGFAVTQWLLTGRMIRARLIDYVRMGWLPPTDVRRYGTWWGRVRAIFFALISRPRVFFATISLIRAETELAHLRDGMTRGIISDAGLEREKQLFDKIRRVRRNACDGSGRVAKARVTPASVYEPASSHPGPAGLGGHWTSPQPGGAAIGAGAGQYSAVDPKWGPPR